MVEDKEKVVEEKPKKKVGPDWKTRRLKAINEIEDPVKSRKLAKKIYR